MTNNSSNDLFMSILAMDAYNQGSDGGTGDKDGLGDIGSTIGNATIIAENRTQEAQTADFYSVAYEPIAHIS